MGSIAKPSQNWLVGSIQERAADSIGAGILTEYTGEESGWKDRLINLYSRRFAKRHKLVFSLSSSFQAFEGGEINQEGNYGRYVSREGKKKKKILSPVPTSRHLLLKPPPDNVVVVVVFRSTTTPITLAHTHKVRRRIPFDCFFFSGRRAAIRARKPLLNGHLNCVCHKVVDVCVCTCAPGLGH